MKNNMLVLSGAVAGAIVGHVLCVWMARQGFYALVLPGGLAGLGAGCFRCRAIWVAVVSAFIGLGATLVTEWHLAPFIADDSFGYFVTHVGLLRPVTLAMMAIGTALAFWMPFRRRA